MPMTSGELYNWIIQNWRNKVFYQQGQIDPVHSPVHNFVIYFNLDNKKVFTWNKDSWTQMGTGGGGQLYQLPVATQSQLGGVRIGNGITVDENGLISVDIPQPYQLPTASTTTLGGIKVGAGLQIDGQGKLQMDSDILQQVVIAQDIVSSVNVGGISRHQTIPLGMTFNDFAVKLLSTVYYPTFTIPSATMLHDKSQQLQVGEIIDVKLTMTFNRGSINGDNIDETWDPQQFQNYRSGQVTHYILGGTNTGLVNQRIIQNYTILLGTNNWVGTVHYEQGPQPKDSRGNDYMQPLAAWQLNRNATIFGRRKSFFGGDTTVNETYTTSEQIRSLNQHHLNPQKGDKLQLNAPTGSKMITIAIPASLGSIQQIMYHTGQVVVTQLFNLTNISVQGANEFSGVQYNVYTYIPQNPFDHPVRFDVTI